MDFSVISHIATYKTSLPFLHFFDGFRTSHEIDKVEEVSYDVMKEMLPIKEIEAFKKRAHNPTHPVQTGTAQNADIFFQNREACNLAYDNVYDIVEKTMNEFAKLTGRKYKPFDYVGAKDATEVIVVMGSGADTVEEVVTELNKNKRKVGLIKVRLYRPFDSKSFCASIPSTVKKISVLDRTKEPGSNGEPLYLDVVAALNQMKKDKIQVLSGRFGLAGKNFIPEDANAIFENMKSKSPIHRFTVGINDDVSKISLKHPKSFK
jgi:pyruvate-ferredoxin/flavodoxin oxidoreductase